MTSNPPLPSSFRDDAGFVFQRGGIVYRQVNASFAQDFEAFRSRVYPKASDLGWVLPFEVEESMEGPGAHCTLRPEQLPFVSYPFEWSFDLLKEAALVTLNLALLADAEGMELRDATPYNLQWSGGRMQHMDHLSTGLKKGEGPWPAYRQFCEAFLAPLALMHFTQAPLQALGLGWMEGIPLAVARKWLPLRSRMQLHLLLHLHIHGKAAVKKGGLSAEVRSLPSGGRQRIFESLRSAVEGLQFSAPSGSWSGYYSEAEGRGTYLRNKEEIIAAWLEELHPKRVFDAGANEGHFSLLAARDPQCTVIAGEQDHFSVNQLYRKIRKEGPGNLHPVLFDFAHPSPALGLNGTERPSLFQRVRADVVLALALVHHLFHTEGIPFSRMAEGFRMLGRDLIIEWVPANDPKVQMVVAQRFNPREGYTLEAFLAGFAAAYTVEKEEAVGDSGRRLYFLRAR